jgi:hypothetical protein
MSSLPTNPEARKACPIATGFLDYFPDAIACIAHLSQVGNDQHNPGKPLHWDRSKSGDEADALMRHFMERGTSDTDGVRHSAKMAWRALALLQKEIEADKKPSAAPVEKAGFGRKNGSPVRKCASCGKDFAPEYGGQLRCIPCIDSYLTRLNRNVTAMPATPAEYDAHRKPIDSCTTAEWDAASRSARKPL